MGSEDLFKRRRAPKKNKELGRKSPCKDPLAKILIVCEGLKTEPTYFEDFVAYYELLTANVIDVTGDCGSSPMCVFRKAKKIQNEMIEKGAPYDELYIVIDKDAHTDYTSALDAINRVRPPSKWLAINSVPCFEFWLLLHYTYTTKAYNNLPGNSSGNQIVKELRKYIKEYEKGAKGIFLKTLNALKTKDLKEVITKAIKCNESAHKSDTDNPTTFVYQLVGRLLELNQQKNTNKK